MAAKGNLITGARTRLLIEGVKVGYATNVDVNENIQYEPANVLDNIRTEEHVAVGYDVSGTIGKLRIVNTTFKSLGYFPKTGGSPQEHLANILALGELTGQLEDVPTGKIYGLLQQIKFQARSISIQARAIVSTNVSFVAILFRDESEIPAA